MCAGFLLASMYCKKSFTVYHDGTPLKCQILCLVFAGIYIMFSTLKCMLPEIWIEWQAPPVCVLWGSEILLPNSTCMFMYAFADSTIS